jgi:hypothetical protein
VQRWLVETEVEGAPRATHGAGNACHAQSRALDLFCRVLYESEGAAAERTRFRYREHVDDRRGGDSDRLLGRAAWLQAGEAVEIAHQLVVRSRPRATDGSPRFLP